MGLFNRFFNVQLRQPEPDQGRFDLNKIKDGLYKKLFDTSRIDSIKGINKRIDEDISNLRQHVLDFNRKVSLVDSFLKTGNIKDLEKLKQELQKIRKIVAREYDEDRKEDTYTLKALKSIKDIIAKEKDLGIEADEYGLLDRLKMLRKDVENLEPVLVRQLKFFEMPAEEQTKNIKSLLFDIKEEATIIGYEEKLTESLKKDINRCEIEAILAPDE